MAAAQAGDRESFALLFDRFAQRAYRCARALLGSSADADDAVQEAFVAAWVGIRSFRVGMPFFPWPYRLLRHAVGNVAGSRIPGDTLLDTDCAASGDDPTARLEIALALQDLDVPKREVVLLHYALGYTAGEIAEMCGLPVGTVKSRLRLARQALKRMLREG